MVVVHAVLLIVVVLLLLLLLLMEMMMQCKSWRLHETTGRRATTTLNTVVTTKHFGSGRRSRLTS
jgi:hypothetical protein